MEATPDVYRADILRTKEALAALVRRMALVPPGLPWRTADLERSAALGRHLKSLEQGLARAEVLWAQAQAQGAGTRLP